MVPDPNIDICLVDRGAPEVGDMETSENLFERAERFREMALKERPDLVYILTDGEFPDSEKAVEIIRRLNKDHLTKINTIAFINDDDIKHGVDVGFKKILKDIASDNGGTFNDVNPDEL